MSPNVRAARRFSPPRFPHLFPLSPSPGIGVGGLLLIIVIALIVWCCLRRGQKDVPPGGTVVPVPQPGYLGAPQGQYGQPQSPYGQRPPGLNQYPYGQQQPQVQFQVSGRTCWCWWRVESLIVLGVVGGAA